MTQSSPNTDSGDPSTTQSATDGGAGKFRRNLGQTARETASKARERTGAYADKQKSRVVREIQSISRALGRAAGQLRDEESMAATPLEYVSQSLDELSQDIEGESLGELSQDLENFARRNPAAFVGGAMALGFLAGRFFKSDSERSHEPSEQDSGTWEDASAGNVSGAYAEPAASPSGDQLSGDQPPGGQL